MTITHMDMIMGTITATTTVTRTSRRKRRDTITGMATAITMDMPTVPATSAA